MTVLGLNMFLHIGLGYFPQVFHKYSIVCYCHGIFSYFVTGFWKGFFFFSFSLLTVFFFYQGEKSKRMNHPIAPLLLMYSQLKITLKWNMA